MSDAEQSQSQSQTAGQSQSQTQGGPDTKVLKIRHVTRYDYDRPVDYGVSQIRLTPKSTAGQTVRSWSTSITGGVEELSFDDAHRNRVNLLSTTPGATEIEIVVEGVVETEDRNGVVGLHAGFMPLWMFKRTTPATTPGPLTRQLAKDCWNFDDTISCLHALSSAVRGAVAYETGVSKVDWTAEEALVAGRGVCQDHAHIFIAAARAMDLSARYVSGYLMIDDRVEQEATHAWAEAWVDGLGWTGFDVSNAIAPDARYVRVATGLDYSDASPLSGTRFGHGNANMSVAIQVQQ